MHRNACWPSEQHVGNGNNNNNQNNINNNNETTTNGNTSPLSTAVAVAVSDVPEANNIKKEFVAVAPAEVQAVVHRKSERRRVARDIFLILEEQPNRRRGRGGAKGKSTRAKQKFGHLKVQNPKPSKCIPIREIKTEPKCVPAAVVEMPLELPALNATVTTVASVAVTEPPETAVPPPPEPVQYAVQPLQTVAEEPVAPKPPKDDYRQNIKTIKVETKTAQNATPAIIHTSPVTTQPLSATTHTHNTDGDEAACTEPPPAKTPSVNPIFLWVKQDDTRIVEVRCEDYDKRNRIRLTKTTNGWRSMPRTDASSTRIVKFFQSATSPLLKVKREVYEQHQTQMQQVREQQNEQVEEQLAQMSLEVPPIDDVPQTEFQQSEKLLHDWHESQSSSTLTATPTTPHYDSQSSAHIDYTPPEIVDDVLVTPPSCVTASVPLDHIADSDKPKSSPGNLSEVNFNSLLAQEQHGDQNTPTYQSSTTPLMELQLCPKTGLFLPKGATAALPVEEEEQEQAEQNASVCLLDKHPLLKIADCVKPAAIDNDDVVVVEEGDNATESLDANTKNLKDLLDDADLLQHCSSDNGSNGAELLDSLVKRSCEDNLVQDTSSSGTTAATVSAAAAEAMMKDALSSFGGICADLNELADKDLPPIMDMVSDAPKCLSFNEAGEIEGLNGELFQSNNFIDTFEKETPIVVVAPLTVDSQQEVPGSPTAIIEKTVDETPKDLSYKKREEVCPPSESRSQCAVTSSSDILKSPGHESGDDVGNGIGGIPVEVETTSETIKNLILEQFIKLNALNQLPGMPAVVVANNQQVEPIDLGKSREKPATVPTRTASSNNNNNNNNNYMETVVLDEDEDEPLKKRRCKNNIKLDKDPDALTQLKMLLSNSQWKVPDPILVPKDRLGAVLASPAREIPLLLTTRPELRLPEAFAYPEIIQNPNILVISMAQLEAILRNDVEQELLVKQPMHSDELVLANSNINNNNHKQPHASPKDLHKQPQPHATHIPQPSPLPPMVKEPIVMSNKCPHTPQPADSSLATDINAATLAVLQQMLWLPYFGQLSQEFLKTFKDPLGLQRKYANNMLPFYSNSQFGLQHLDELYKHYMKQMSGTPKPMAETPPSPQTPKVQPTPPTTPATPQPNYNGFSNPVELAFFQKLFQPQMPNYLNMNAAAAQCTPSPHHQQTTPTPLVKHHPATVTAEMQSEQKRSRRNVTEAVAAAAAATAATGLDSLNIPDFNSNFSAQIPATGGNKAAQQHQAVEKKQPMVEHKPRLTCKSLSNLLEPENINGAAAVPLLNVPFDGLRRATPHSKTKQDGAEAAAGNNTRTLRSSKASVTFNAVEQVKQQQQQQPQQSQQRKRNNTNHHMQPELAHVNPSAAAAMRQATDINATNMDMNAALWHPLFGSNPKQGYNSPWQWTTVTATGE